MPDTTPTFGSGTTPYFSPNSQSGYPTPPEQWSRLHYNIPLQPSPDTSPYCNLPKTDGKQLSNKYDSLFQLAAAKSKCKVDWRFIKALAATESGPDFTNVIQKDGLGRGVMQIDMGAHKDFTETMLLDPATNISIGTQILCDFWRKYHTAQDAFAHYKSKGDFNYYINLSGAQTTWNKFLSYLRSEGVSV